jgi:hypothetical protein
VSKHSDGTPGKKPPAPSLKVRRGRTPLEQRSGTKPVEATPPRGTKEAEPGSASQTGHYAARLGVECSTSMRFTALRGEGGLAIEKGFHSLSLHLFNIVGPRRSRILVRSNLTSDWSKLGHNFWVVAIDTAMLIAGWRLASELGSSTRSQRTTCPSLRILKAVHSPALFTNTPHGVSSSLSVSPTEDHVFWSQVASCQSCSQIGQALVGPSLNSSSVGLLAIDSSLLQLHTTDIRLDSLGRHWLWRPAAVTGGVEKIGNR